MMKLLSKILGSNRKTRVYVDGAYFPSEVAVKAGKPVKLQFKRLDKSFCTREVVFPELGITRDLPTGELVTIELPALPAGEVPFHCGMAMLHGRIIVEA